MYYPQQPNQPFQIGVMGPNVSALQTSLNTQGAGLNVDGKYGPLTHAAFLKYNQKPQPFTTMSSTPARQQLGGLNKQFNSLMQTGDPFDSAIAQMFQLQQDTNAKAEKNAIASSSAAAQNAQFQQSEDQARENAAQATAALQTGEARNAPAYAAAQAAQVNERYRKQTQILRNEENIAVAKAKQARAENDLQTYGKMVEYIQQIRKAKADALKQANDAAWEQLKFEKEMAWDKQKFNMNYGLDQQR